MNIEKEMPLTKIGYITMNPDVLTTNLLKKSRKHKHDDHNEDIINAKRKKDALPEILTITEDFVYKFLSNYCKLCNVDMNWINVEMLTEYVFNKLPEKIEKEEFYIYASESCIEKSSSHPDYNILASKIFLDQLYMKTPDNIRDTYNKLYYNYDTLGKHSPLINERVYKIIIENADLIESKINLDNDNGFDVFGLKTLEKSFLKKIYKGKTPIIIERPQYLIMRVSIGIHYEDLESVFETYSYISQRYFTHATPTLFNSGTTHTQLASCFLLGMDDNTENIGLRNLDMMKISKNAGGIGLHIHSLRAKGSLIRSSGGKSNGIIPACIAFDKLISKWFDQGGNRPGSLAVYLEPWHLEIFEFCELKKNTGNDDNRARDLFLALWIPDLFMKRVEEDGIWSLMCPDECKGLSDCYGNDFDTLYLEYENKKMYRKQVKAQKLWQHIIECQIETGLPYICYKDSVNNKCNQKNIGTIKSSNLCAEITEYSDGKDIAVCNLASICLPKFIENKQFNYNKLIDICRIVVRNLNKTIDVNYYTTEDSRNTNMKNRPIGIGIQGLADVYIKMGYPFESDAAMKLNKLIFETIYYGCISESNNLSIKHGSYETFDGSPFSEGKLQFHLWGLKEEDLSGRYDWKSLIESIKKYGTRNSLLTALMPTATTSQIMRNSQSFEPYTSNYFMRKTMACEFAIINEHLVRDLIKENLWNDDIRKLIIINNGSIQTIQSIPQKIKEIYKTVFEIKLKSIVQQSVERGPFIDQSQSMDLYLKTPDFTKLTAALFYGWKNGIKTGMYYLRTCPSVNPVNIGIDLEDIKRLTGITNIDELISNEYKINELPIGLKSLEREEQKEEVKVCKYIPGRKMEGCDMCSS